MSGSLSWGLKGEGVEKVGVLVSGGVEGPLGRFGAGGSACSPSGTACVEGSEGERANPGCGESWGLLRSMEFTVGFLSRRGV